MVEALDYEYTYQFCAEKVAGLPTGDHAPVHLDTKHLRKWGFLTE